MNCSLHRSRFLSRMPAGKTLSDVELQRFNWYVDGVDGALPK
jgi:simple sugar transport system substrate-binding protein